MDNVRKDLKIILLNHLYTLSKVVLGLIICLIISLQSGYAQNVDQGRSNKKKLRETKLKTRNKQGDRTHKGDISGRKKKSKKTKNKNKISSPSSSPYSNVFYRNKGRKKEGKQVQKSNGYFNQPSRPTESYRKGDISGKKSRKSVTKAGENKSVKRPSSPYAGRKYKTERQKAKTSRALAGGFQSITKSGENKKRKSRKIQPRTASQAFVIRKKVNAYAGKARRGERAKTKDIAGRRLRSKNYRSRTQPISKPSFTPYFAKTKKRKGDQARRPIKGTGFVSASRKGERKYQGQAAGGHSSATKKGENAWKKDITGRSFKRPKDPGIVTGKKGQPFTGTQNRILSISSALKNNNRRSITQKGAGGSISNNISKRKNKAIPRKNLGSKRISGFAGNIKRSRKSLKGGGSISRFGWNNNQKPLQRKDFGSTRISGFAGNIKRSRKPLKGGGSISKTGWNNNQKPLQRKDFGSTRISGFAGNIKRSRKSLKGGGSISKPGWNNNQKPLQKKSQSRQNSYSSKYVGSLKVKGKYKDKPHTVKNALKTKKPNKNMFQMSGYHGKLKDRRNHRKNPNSHDDALKGIAPGKAVSKLDSYISKHTKVRYAKKPNAHKDALKSIAPKNNASKAQVFQGNFKVKKNHGKNMHPSSKYTTSLHPRNSIKEKGRTFKFNIWWAKLFKKNQNQPTAVKEKTRKPRYDKREKDLWYD